MITRKQLWNDYRKELDRRPAEVREMDDDAWYVSLCGLASRYLREKHIDNLQWLQELASKID